MKTSGDTIAIKTKFSTTIEKVWSAWTEPMLISQWFGSDPAGKVLTAELDVRPGGRFEISFKDSNGSEHTCSGVYKDVELNSKLSFTWLWKNEPGIQSFVTVLLISEGNTTLMQFEHTNLGYTSAHNYMKGWNDTFLKLERMLTAASFIQG